MRYRKEVDGLRALAVMPVLLYHAGSSWFSGGYVGVDVFFVISGYLITTLIIEERRQGSFSIVDFYERRARRILPALSVVLLITLIAAYLLMPAEQLKLFSESLNSVSVFASNIYFFLKTSYFSFAVDEQPLIHTWSLAVEEQYYVFFPLLITGLWFLGTRRLHVLIAGLSIVSLGLSQYLLRSDHADASFYLIASRAWELFAGSIIAFLLPEKRRLGDRTCELAGIAGLAMILTAVFVYTKETPFPGLYALLPVAGTCLVLIFAGGGTWTGKILANRVMVSIGLISYSLYLWHQPLYAFIRMKSANPPPLSVFLVAIVFSTVLAYLSWKYIETPFRDRRRFTRRQIFQYSAATIVIFASVGLVGYLERGFENRFQVVSYSDSITHSPLRECNTYGENYRKYEDACRYFGRNITWATFGDSHSVELAYALAEKLRRKDEGLVHLSFSACPPALLFRSHKPGCTDWINESLTHLKNDDGIRNVLLGFAYWHYFRRDENGRYPYIPDLPENILQPELHPELKGLDTGMIFWRSLEAIINELLAAGKNVYVVYPFPTIPAHIHRATIPFWVFGEQTLLDLKHTTELSTYRAHNRFIIDKLDTLPYGEHLHAIDPVPFYCESVYCSAVRDGKALYYDSHHPSLNGARINRGRAERARAAGASPFSDASTTACAPPFAPARPAL